LCGTRFGLRFSGPRRALIGLIALLAIAGLGPGEAHAAFRPDAAPSSLLLHAGIPEVLSFAAETARQRGWTVLHSGPASVTFEQPIDADDTTAPAILRIQASFAKSPAGVTVTLRAEEVRDAAEPRDVTQQYRDNLLNALDALASKWGLRPTTPTKPPPTPAAPTPTPAAAPAAPASSEPAPRSTLTRSTPNPAPAPGPRHRVGTWAYYAERYAEGLGCALGDLGSVLEGSAGAAEVHRVHCADGRQVLVRCLAGVCSGAY
jgi:hypothetical protein